MLVVNQLTGFSSSSGLVISLSISANTDNYNIFNSAQSAGDPTRDGVTVNLTLDDTVIIGSTSTSNPAMTRGSGWGAMSTVNILVPTGTARIVGMGGAGGDGSGEPGKGSHEGGGGGGGGGSNVGAGGTGCENAGDGSNGTATAGGSGGTSNLNAGNCTGTDGSAGGPALEAPNAGEDIDLRPSSGATLELWGGGGGGGGGGFTFDGGNGGAPANAGSDTLSFSGGAAGASTTGSGTVNQVGPGTIDTDGP